MYTISGETSKPVEKCMATVVTGIFALIKKGGPVGFLQSKGKRALRAGKMINQAELYLGIYRLGAHLKCR